jgi:raffinose/stachyose/melibiose transport system permease protein
VIGWERGSKWVGANWKVSVLVVVSIPWIFVPLWLLLVNSFKPYTEAASLTLSLPRHWAILSNYGTALHQWGFLAALKNSAIVVIPTMLVVVFCGSLAAWAFARSRSMTMKVVFNISVLSILLPPAVLPTIYLLEKFHLQATLWGYTLAMMGTRMGIVIFLTTGFLRSFPRSLEDAAAIDGANRLQTYRRIILPLLRPVLLVGGVILIISVWNEFFFALFLLGGSNQSTLPLALYQHAASSATNQVTYLWNLIFADVVLTSLPVLVIYLFVNRRLISGLSEGALKG